MSLVEIRDQNGKGMTLLQHEEFLLPTLWIDPPRKLAEIKHFPYLEGDIILSSYPKSGTHWVHALVSRLLKRTDIENSPTDHLPMIDMYPTQVIAAKPSPRLISTHLTYKYLPEEHKQKQGKIILILRNPKDVAVSFYHFAIKTEYIFYDGSPENFVSLFLAGKVPYNSYFDWLNDWSNIITEGSHQNILVISYEDLKKDCFGYLKRISKYLSISSIDDDLLIEVCNKCSHNNLKIEAEQGKVPYSLVDENGSSTIYRKGEVGDWKNHFTVADNEKFDQVISESLRNCSFQFQYA